MTHRSPDDSTDGPSEPPGDEMASDERFDGWLTVQASGYNRPDDPPRRAMWESIDRALSAQQEMSPVAGSLSPASSTPDRATAVRGGPASALWGGRRSWQLAAAALLLAAGIGIGRLWRVAGRTSELPVATTIVPERQAESANTLDVATLQHLSRAEALLTAFRTEGAESAESPVVIERWARDLLADTRLFLDSPAATDARRRHLLEDLELVLAQIVQLHAESSADRALVQNSMERAAVLSRLRSTIPAGFLSGT